MSGIAVFHFTRFQIEHTDKHRDEHILRIHIRHRLIQCLYDSDRMILLSGDHAQEATRHRHHQARRNTLSAHVTDTEKQFLVTNEEVVQVPSDILGRNQGAVNMHIRTFRIGREYLGKHRHLYAVCDTQLTLDLALLLHGVCQFPYVLFQVFLHVVHRPAQVPQFVPVLHLRQ